MSIEIVAFEDDHLADSAALVAAEYGRMREREPALPARYQDPAAALPFLTSLKAQGLGVAALESGQLVGFMLSRASMFNALHTAWTPDYAHATSDRNGREVYREMYARLAANWVEIGCFTHIVSIMAHHRQAIDAFHSLGFGMTNVDAVREVGSSTPPNDSVTIREAELDDADSVESIERRLARHLTSSPVFLPALPKPQRRNSLETRLSDSAAPTWLAYCQDRLAGCLSAQTSAENPLLARADDESIALVRGYVEPDYRNQGIGTALVGHALEWGRGAGFRVCGVDFESANIEATRFWLGIGFRPVAYSLTRRLDDRIAWATN